MKIGRPVKKVCACGCKTIYYKDLIEASEREHITVEVLRRRITIETYDYYGYKWHWATREEYDVWLNQNSLTPSSSELL